MGIVKVGEQQNRENEEAETHAKQMAEMMRHTGPGLKNVEGGMLSWKWPFNNSEQIVSPIELKKLIDSENDREKVFLLDVRSLRNLINGI